MKITLTVLGLIVALGVLYGLAFLGVLPVQKWAAKSPAMAKALAKIHLAAPKLKKPALQAAAPKPDPARQALQAQEQQIAADRDQLNHDRAAFEAEKQQATDAPATPAPADPDTSAKLSAILATMSPDDIAKIFAKLPDPAVIQNLLPLDEKKAGQVLAALPADRAARLSRQMMTSPTPQRTAANPAQPQTSLP